MKAEGTIYHRNGGVITRVRAIAHETYKRVASWHYIADVEWNDGHRSEARQVTPHELCAEPTDEKALARINALAAEMQEYLNQCGTWHDAKHTKDGRVSFWTPHNASGVHYLKETA